MGPNVVRAPGERVGAFEIVRHLASGGMGDVYVARDVATDEQVALKLVSADLETAETLPTPREIPGEGTARVDRVPQGWAAGVRFEREARIATRLRHPHLVAARASGRAPDGTAYLAMELLEGRDLDVRLREGRLPAPDAVAIAMQVCDALTYAHGCGVVHRDLKPKNIFLCDGPALHAKVLDFGIAQLATERRTTRTGNVLGTLAYISPEQSRGERDMDHRTDVWSLGVVLYQCLAQRLPFEADSGPATLFRILMDAPPSLARLRPDLPPALVSAVRTALSKSRDDRFATAAAMRAALAAVDFSRVATPSVPPREAPASSVPADPDAEQRLVSVVAFRAVRDRAVVDGAAAELHGRAVDIAGRDALVVFGLERWHGDEPYRAVRLATLAGPAARGVGVATGRALRDAVGVAGAVVDVAAALADGDGVAIDATTAALTRDGAPLAVQPDGTARLVAAAHRAGRDAGAMLESAAPFVGRDAERAVLVQSVAAARDEMRPRIVSVAGVPGIGKTRLCHEALAAVARHEAHATTLLARCDGARRDTPFAGLSDALAPAVDPGVAALLSRAGGAPRDPVAALDLARATLEAALAGLAQRGPVVLALDDAQWLDGASRAALAWLVDNADELPLAVWLFVRPEARDAAAAATPGAVALDLPPLPRDASAEVVRAIAGDAPGALLDRAAGHPLFLEELARLYAARGATALADAALPPSVEAALLAQVDQLTPAERDFLKRAAVVGGVFWLEAAVALGASAEALAGLRRAGLVVPRPRGRFEGARELAFRAELLREVAYQLWPEAQRQRLHVAAAEWLELHPASPAERARHYDLGGEPERAAGAYAAAAEAAAHVAETATTCAHAARTLALTHDAELRWRALLARDTALQNGGDRALRRDGVSELVTLAAGFDVARQAEAAWRQCSVARMFAERDAALAAGARALELARLAGDVHAGAQAGDELAMVYAADGRFDLALEHALAARAQAAQAGNPWLLARALATHGYVMAEAGDAVAALPLMEAGADEYARMGDRRREAAVRANAGSVMLDLGRVEEAAVQLAVSVEASRRVGNARAAATALYNLGVARRLLGDAAGAAAIQTEARAAATALPFPRLLSAVATEQLYAALAGNAAPATLADLAAEAERVAEAAQSPTLLVPARAAAARAYTRTGATRVDAAAIRALAAQLAGDPRLLQVLVATYEAAGRTAADLRAVHDELDRLTVAAGDDDAACRAALVGKYAVPAEAL